MEIVLIVLLGLLVVGVLFIAYKLDRFKSRIENSVVDGVKQVIVENGPKVIKSVKKKLKIDE